MFTVVGDVWPAAKKGLRARGNEEERSSKSITDGLDLRSGLGKPKNQDPGTRFQPGGGGQAASTVNYRKRSRERDSED
jgi:hypothetical protein